MPVIQYLDFDGRCEEAIEFYTFDTGHDSMRRG